MKRIGAIFFVLLLLVSFVAWAEHSRKHDAVVAHLKSGQEPKVRDAVWATSSILKIGVHDNGSPRDGYAQYFCMVLAEQGFSGENIRVEIIDYGSVLRGESWKVLGVARCK